MKNTTKIGILCFGYNVEFQFLFWYAIKQELFTILMHLLDKLVHQMIIKLYVT